MMNTRRTPKPQFITVWANKIKQLGLRTPAVLMLEIHKPFSFIAGQFLLAGQPFLEPFLPSNLTDDAVTLLSDRAYLDDLIQELERG